MDYRHGTLVFAAALGLNLGCGPIDDLPDPAAKSSPYYDIQIDRTGPSGFEARLPDGSTITDPTSFDVYLPTIKDYVTSNGLELRYVTGKSITNDLNVVFGAPSGTQTQVFGGFQRRPQDFVWYVGQYVISAGCDRKPVGGCISQSSVPKCSLRLRTNPSSGKGQLLFDLHVAVWTDSDGRTCLGLYDSGLWQLANSCPCTPLISDVADAYNHVREYLEDIFLAAGVPLGAAWVMSQVGAPLITGGLVAVQ